MRSSLFSSVDVMYVVYHLDYFAKAEFCMPASDIYAKSNEVSILELVNCDDTLISCVCEHKIVECLLQLRYSWSSVLS